MSFWLTDRQSHDVHEGVIRYDSILPRFYFERMLNEKGLKNDHGETCR